jgi:exodeoxyribonuclease-3
VFEALGYTHRAIHGQKGYHGVATVSRLPLREVSRHDWQDNGEARHVGVELLGAGQGLILENVYIPAGGDVADRDVNPKFGQKLDFLDRMTRWADALDRPTLIVGDFNIAPLPTDVYDHKALLKVVSHTPIEVEALQRFADAHGWVDLGRKHIPRPSATIRGGPIARTGARRTRGAASTTCGPRPTLPRNRPRTASSKRPAAGSSLRTISR